MVSSFLGACRQVDYDLLASTVTKLSSAIGAVDASAVPAAITTTLNTTRSKSSSKRKQRDELRTPKRKGCGSSRNDDASSSALSEDQHGAELVTLGNKTKMSRIGQHVGTLRHDARSINNRIAEIKGLINKHQIDALETKSGEKIALVR